MCFYDQTVYSCDDTKWGNFRAHCSKEYRTGETCGMKLVNETFHVNYMCKICHEIEIKQRRIEKQDINLSRWWRSDEVVEPRKSAILTCGSEISMLKTKRLTDLQEFHPLSASSYSGVRGRTGNTNTRLSYETSENMYSEVPNLVIQQSIAGPIALEKCTPRRPPSPIFDKYSISTTSTKVPSFGSPQSIAVPITLANCTPLRPSSTMFDKYSIPNSPTKVNPLKKTRSRLTIFAISMIIITIRRFINRSNIARVRSRRVPIPVISFKNIAPRIEVLKKQAVASWLIEMGNSPPSSESNSLDSFEDETTDYSSLAEAYAEGEYEVETRHFIEAMGSTLRSLGDILVSKILNELTTIIEVSFSKLGGPKQIVHGCSADCHSKTSHCHSQLYESTSLQSIQNSSREKRKETVDEEDDDVSDHGENDRNCRKRVKTGHKPKWACPYYQREPHRYCLETEHGDFRKCARSPGFDLVHRVKDHIYKCHYKRYCDRCYAVFKKDEDLKTHRRSVPACDLRESQHVEGLTDEQKSQLIPRDRRSANDVERWNVIYRICFPDDEAIPSPYYVHYSREIAELRRDVFSIISTEMGTPNVDIPLLMERIHGAFDGQISRMDASASRHIPTLPDGEVSQHIEGSVETATEMSNSILFGSIIEPLPSLSFGLDEFPAQVAIDDAPQIEILGAAENHEHSTSLSQDALTDTELLRSSDQGAGNAMFEVDENPMEKYSSGIDGFGSEFSWEIFHDMMDRNDERQRMRSDVADREAI